MGSVFDFFTSNRFFFGLLSLILLGAYLFFLSQQNQSGVDALKGFVDMMLGVWIKIFADTVIPTVRSFVVGNKE